MKTARSLFPVSRFFFWLLMASFGLGQDSAISPSLPLPPPPPPPPAPAQPRSAPSPFNRPPPPPVRGTFGVSVPQSEIHLNQDTVLTVWTSEEQMNYYFINQYIQSGISMAGVGGGMLSNLPPMKMEPMARLVLAQDIKINGENVTAVDSYRLDKFELIGLARHDPAVAFVINRHPPFQVLRQSPNSNRGNTRGAEPVTPIDIRPLTDFEKQALADIKAGKDISIQPQPDGSRLVVGAIRAQITCTQCHDTYKAGDALGAFSYHLSKASLFDNLPASTSSPLTPAR